MTVKQLIDELAKQHPDAEVRVCYYEGLAPMPTESNDIHLNAYEYRCGPQRNGKVVRVVEIDA